MKKRINKRKEKIRDIIAMLLFSIILNGIIIFLILNIDKFTTIYK